jgi:hypothetical protein
MLESPSLKISSAETCKYLDRPVLASCRLMRLFRRCCAGVLTCGWTHVWKLLLHRLQRRLKYTKFRLRQYDDCILVPLGYNGLVWLREALRDESSFVQSLRRNWTLYRLPYNPLKVTCSFTFCTLKKKKRGVTSFIFIYRVKRPRTMKEVGPASELS